MERYRPKSEAARQDFWQRWTDKYIEAGWDEEIVKERMTDLRSRLDNVSSNSFVNREFLVNAVFIPELKNGRSNDRENT